MLKGYKTYIFNGLMALIMIARAFMPDAELPDDETVRSATDALVDNWDAFFLVVGNLALRAFTNSPVFFKANK